MSEHPHWLDEPEDHDYPAAKDYLALLMSPPLADLTVGALRGAYVTHFKAKDILRASQLPLLPTDNTHVAKDLDKIHDGKKLSPVLLVRGENARPLIIADGYHRVCASWHVDECADIPCKIA